MKPKLAIIVGNNFEEIELITTVDILRRAKLDVDIISLFNEKEMVGAHKIKVGSDKLFSEFDQAQYSGLIIPGGPGVDMLDKPLIEQDNLISLIQDFVKADKMVAAICAAPQLLGKAEVVNDKQLTHFPGSDKFMDHSHVDLKQKSIVDGKIITGRSAGTAIDFALNIVEYWTNSETKAQVANHLVI